MGERKKGGAGAVYSFRTIGVSKGEGWRSCALLPGDLFLLLFPSLYKSNKLYNKSTIMGLSIQINMMPFT